MFERAYCKPLFFFLSLNSMYLNEEPGTHNSLEAVSELPGFSVIDFLLIIDYKYKKAPNKELSSKDYLHYYSSFLYYRRA